MFSWIGKKVGIVDFIGEFYFPVKDVGLKLSFSRHH